jgi:hypothetical protein
VTNVALNAGRRRADTNHVPELSVHHLLAPLAGSDPNTGISPVIEQARPIGALADSAVCPECLTRNAIEAPVDFEGWGDRPRRIGPCISCRRQLFYLPGDSMLIVWNLGD